MKAWKAGALALALAVAGCGTTTRPGAVGIERKQLLIVPSGMVEQMALTHYNQQSSKARSDGKLVDSGPEYERLRAVSDRLVRQTAVFRDDTRTWKWQLTYIDAPVLNATCAPGGKITFYTGLVRKLELTDDEIAAVMGHEIAHALREHGREKVSESMGQQLVVAALGASTRTPAQTTLLANQMAKVMYELPNSREKESEADRIGLELMARAGYDPAAAVSVWKKMGAATAGKNGPEFLSTHPAPAARMKELESLQPLARGLYEAAPKQ